jgi:hypothetical protein
MPLFQINGPKLSLTRPTNFNQEKEIQALIEKNLETVFNCKDPIEDPIGSRLASCCLMNAVKS